MLAHPLAASYVAPAPLSLEPGSPVRIRYPWSQYNGERATVERIDRHGAWVQLARYASSPALMLFDAAHLEAVEG